MIGQNVNIGQNEAQKITQFRNILIVLSVYYELSTSLRICQPKMERACLPRAACQTEGFFFLDLVSRGNVIEWNEYYCSPIPRG